MPCLRQVQLFCLGFLAALNAGCVGKRAELGTADNPIKFFLVPSVEHSALEESGKAIQTFLEANTPYRYKISVPTSYIAVVEAFGAKRADVASLNTYGYLLAHQKYQAEARLTVIRNGQSTYQAAIVAHVRSGIKSVQDINGKRMAFVDPTSTSGYLLPIKLFKDLDIKPKETVFAQRHDNVISMIYQGQVDAGAIYYSPPRDRELQDARRLVLNQYPDVEDKIRIVRLTDAIPNDAIVFRKDLPEEMKRKISQGLIQFIASEAGKLALERTFTVSGFKPTTDDDYAATRKMLTELGVVAENMLKK